MIVIIVITIWAFFVSGLTGTCEAIVMAIYPIVTTIWVIGMTIEAIVMTIASIVNTTTWLVALL